MLDAMQSPAARAKRREGIKRAWEDPAFRSRHKAAMDSRHDPKREAKARRQEAEREDRAAAMAYRQERIDNHRRLWADLRRLGPVAPAAVRSAARLNWTGVLFYGRFFHCFFAPKRRPVRLPNCLNFKRFIC